MNKKTNAWIRLITSSLLALCLLSVLFVGIQGKSFFTRSIFNFSNYRYDNAEKYLAGPGVIPTGSGEDFTLRELSIDWIDGEIHVSACDGDAIEISETYSGTLDEEDKLHYYFDRNGKLDIRYQTSKGWFFGFGGSKNHHKKLEVKIPRSQMTELEEFSIDAASSDIDLDGIATKECNLDTVSGNTNCQAMQTDRIDIDNVSGDFYLQGNYREIDMDTVSGALTLDADTVPEMVDTDSTSGDITLNLPADSGFRASHDSVSGDFNCAFDSRQENGKTIYGGTADGKYEFDSVSGNVTIQKRNPSE